MNATIRNLRNSIAAVLAGALLAGCVGSEYMQRQGPRGDYYYGQPRTEYRYHDYGHYGYAPYGSLRYRSYYGNPYGYQGWYRYPYDPYRRGHRPPLVVKPPPDNDERPPVDDDGRAPWRDLDELRRRQQADGGGVLQQRRAVPARPSAGAPPSRPEVTAPRPRPPMRPAPRPRSELGERMQRLNQSSHSREVDER